MRQALHTLPVAAPTAYSPSFSPDGESVYFHAEGRDGSRLMRADTDDRGEVREVATIVDDGAQNFHVRLSPDGSRVAFDSDRDGVRGVYVAGRDGTNVRRVSGPGYAAVPVWSPDGRRAVVRRAPSRSAPRTWNLWRLSLDSGAQQQLTTHRYGQAWPGSWFADGQQICYTHEDRMYVLDLRTGRAAEHRVPGGGRLVRTAAVSPNGTYVVFQVYRDGMWLLDLRDRSMRRVLRGPDRRGVHLVARRPAHRVPQPAGRSLGRLGDGLALVRAARDPAPPRQADARQREHRDRAHDGHDEPRPQRAEARGAERRPATAARRCRCWPSRTPAPPRAGARGASVRDRSTKVIGKTGARPKPATAGGDERDRHRGASASTGAGGEHHRQRGDEHARLVEPREARAA